MLIVESIRYTAPLGSIRYFTLMAAPSGNDFSLLLFDPGPPGTEKMILYHVRKVEKYLRRNLNAKVKRVYLLLTHTHPTTAGSSGSLEKALRQYDVKTYAHVRSIPLIEKGKKPEMWLEHRFERDTHRKLRLFYSLSPVVYRPYYTRYVSTYSLPEKIEPLIPTDRSPETFSRHKLDLDVDVDIRWMRTAGHTYEHVVYRVDGDEFTALVLGDEGPVILGAFPIWYNDSTSRAFALKDLEKRHDAIRNGIEEARVYRTHGAHRYTYEERKVMVTRYLNALWEAASTEFESLEEAIRMRVSDAAAAMLLWDYFSKYPETIKRSKIRKTHYINAENLPIFTTRAALIYLNGRGLHRKIVTRNLDPKGRYRYIEVITP